MLTSNVTGGISDFLWPPSYPADSNTVFLAWEIQKKTCLSVKPCSKTKSFCTIKKKKENKT